MNPRKNEEVLKKEEEGNVCSTWNEEEKTGAKY